ncbi:MAG: hypothetical protein GTN38_04155 [Candidatus Aenigmarchaeota archaeon]|nr:hypothetical protein [Candidatus Aenigmarchaeota archaeon]NIP40854.1 hypothetical protein [Candidatus Aenigmarchaeota archaeon]NIS73557.1 hypothetical protein [Candidatus Aenigmarchaeota archaeon]
MFKQRFKHNNKTDPEQILIMAKSTTLDKVAKVLDKAAKLLRGPYKVASAGVVAAVIGGIIKLQALTQTFPEPFDTVGNVVIFVAVLMVVLDISRGGLLD